MNQSNHGGLEHLMSDGVVLLECIPSPSTHCAYTISRGRLFSISSPPSLISADKYPLYFYIYINRITNRITKFCNS